MKYKYYIADVFTDKPFFGVPLPVFPCADGLTDLQMQQIATELGASCTSFLFESEKDQSRKMRVFSKVKEIDISTHTILAASFVLSKTNSIIKKNTEESHLMISLICENKSSGNKQNKVQIIDTYVTEQKSEATIIQQTYNTHAAIDYYTPTHEDLAAMLSLTTADIGFEHYRPLIVSCGSPYLIVPIKSYHAVRAAKFNELAWSNSSAPSSLAQDILLYSNNTDETPADFHARLLGPSIAHHEDPPIGGAIAAFANHICAHEHIQSGTHVFAVQRGANETRKSLIYIEMDNKKTNDLTIRVGGSAVLMTEAEISF